MGLILNLKDWRMSEMMVWNEHDKKTIQMPLHEKGNKAQGEVELSSQQIKLLVYRLKKRDNDKKAMQTIPQLLENVTRLNLESCGIDTEAAMALSNALKGNTNLKELNLGFNQIYDVGCEAILNAFHNNTTLEALNLQTNVLNNLPIEPIESMGNLKKLILNHNPFKFETLINLLNAENSRLEELHFDCFTSLCDKKSCFDLLLLTLTFNTTIKLLEFGHAGNLYVRSQKKFNQMKEYFLERNLKEVNKWKSELTKKDLEKELIDVNLPGDLHGIIHGYIGEDKVYKKNSFDQFILADLLSHFTQPAWQVKQPDFDGIMTILDSSNKAEKLKGLLQNMLRETKLKADILITQTNGQYMVTLVAKPPMQQRLIAQLTLSNGFRPYKASAPSKSISFYGNSSLSKGAADLDSTNPQDSRENNSQTGTPDQSRFGPP